MGKNSKPVDIYVGGYIASDKDNAGIGWIKPSSKSHKSPSTKSKRVDKKNPPILLTEIYAATEALNSLKPNRDVTVHTTSSELSLVLATQDFSKKIKSAGKNKLWRKAWENLLKATQNHEDVSVVQHENYEDDTLMAQAFNAARQGSELKFFKGDEADKREKKHAKTEIDLDITSMNDGNSSYDAA